jgi:hypothetical protein
MPELRPGAFLTQVYFAALIDIVLDAAWVVT